MNYIIQNKAWEINKEYTKEKLLYLLIDRPDYYCNNSFIWKNNKKQKHRNYDFPVSVCNKTLSWYCKGKNHRNDDKPTIIWYNGMKEYWTNGKRKNIEN